jgi:lysophospholipid acyltransferase (LPLAT)-like uncharacterized protein
VRLAPTIFEGELPAGGSIVVMWHGMTMVTLAAHAELKPHPYRAFVTPGIGGATMRGWLRGCGMEPVPLPPDGAGNPVTALTGC